MKNQETYNGKTPFYMTYPMQNLYLAEMEYEKDMERMRELYPKEVQSLQKLIEEWVDKLEYEGRRIYDEKTLDWRAACAALLRAVGVFCPVGRCKDGHNAAVWRAAGSSCRAVLDCTQNAACMGGGRRQRAERRYVAAVREIQRFK